VTATSTFEILDGRLAVRQTVRSGGTVAYRLEGATASGTITFAPDVRDDQPIPNRLVIQFGDGEHLLATQLHDLPIVHDATLIGGGDRINLDLPGWTRQLILSPHDPETCPAADTAAIARYAHTICVELAVRYRQLDRDALMIAAAKRTAGRRLARCLHQQILPGLALRADEERQLTAAQRLADRLQQLSPLRLLPTSRPGQVTVPAEADVYVSSDDDGDWLTCPACTRPTVMITSGASLGGLLADHAEHRCPPGPA
jgi:hypothetical protein